MDKLIRQAENEKFHEWWLKSVYHYVPEIDEEREWVTVVRYWAWKAWEERASEQVIENERKEKEYYYNESIVQENNVTEALEEHVGELG